MEEVRTIRRRLGVTQTELAEQLGLNQSTISRLEGGRRQLDGRTRLALEALLARKGQAPHQHPVASAASNSGPIARDAAGGSCDRSATLQLGEAAR